jgi:hypothetical protein
VYAEATVPSASFDAKVASLSLNPETFATKNRLEAATRKISKIQDTLGTDMVLITSVF